MRIFKNLNVDFLAKRKMFYIFSASIFLIGLLNIVFRGLGFGIDFLGGTEIALQFDRPIEITEVRDYVNNIGLGDLEVKTFGNERGALIRTELQELPSNLFPKIIDNINKELDTKFPGIERAIVDSTSRSVTYELKNPDTLSYVLSEMTKSGFQVSRADQDFNGTQFVVNTGISEWIKESLNEEYKDNSFKILKEDQVGPKVGGELKRDAVIAIALALVVILIYLGIRFKFVFAIGAVMALSHDVLITLGLYSILYGVIPGLNLEIDLTIVAAFLTLVGYSVSDTVVIFDRVRENIKFHKTLSLYENINSALNKTMSRTILTGGSTLISLFVLVLLGGDVLRAFAFTLFFGIIIGTYSSIFVASAMVYDYSQRFQKRIEF
jgi:preprotein translocase subunit SecF